MAKKNMEMCGHSYCCLVMKAQLDGTKWMVQEQITNQASIAILLARKQINSK